VNNTVNNKPLVYFEDKSDIVIQNAGQVILVNSSNITLEGFNLSNTSIGIELWKVGYPLNSRSINTFPHQL